MTSKPLPIQLRKNAYRPLAVQNQGARLSALLAKGLDLHQGNDLFSAREAYAAILNEVPSHFDALHLMGVAYAQSRDFSLAVDFLSKAVVIKKSHAVAHNNLGSALAELNDWSAAISSYDRALKIDPNYAMAYFNRGVAQEKLRKLDAGLDSYQKSIRLNPGDAKAQSNCGLLLQALGRVDEALDCFDYAIKADPGYVAAYSNRGNLYRELNRYAESIVDFDKAIAIDGNFVEAYSNRGNLYRELNRYAESIVDFDKAIAIDGNFANAHWNKSLTYLFMGKWGSAWDLYPWRWSRSDAGWENPKLPLLADRFQRAENRPAERRVLVWAEQGVGDEIFHASMFAQAAEHFGSVTIQVDKRLLAVMERSVRGAVFIDKSVPVDMDRFDVHLAHGDLGYFFRRNAQDFHYIEYRYLQPDVSRANTVLSDLKTTASFLCGITWQSNNKRLGSKKSIELEQLLPILRNPALSFVNLQYGDTSDEVAAFTAKHGVEIINCPSVDNFSDIDGHAALIAACDFVLTVSNSTAHLAGALGKKTLLMLSRGDGRLWYWANRDGDQSLWYPAIRIYEQRQCGEWGDVISYVSKIIDREYPGNESDIRGGV